MNQLMSAVQAVLCPRLHWPAAPPPPPLFCPALQSTRSTQMTDDSNVFSTPDTSFLGDRPGGSARKSALATPAMAQEDCSPLELAANERRNFMLAAQAVCADTIRRPWLYSPCRTGGFIFLSPSLAPDAQAGRRAARAPPVACLGGQP
jgi:hypothetical protein